MKRKQIEVSKSKSEKQLGDVRYAISSLFRIPARHDDRPVKRRLEEDFEAVKDEYLQLKF